MRVDLRLTVKEITFDKKGNQVLDADISYTEDELRQLKSELESLVERRLYVFSDNEQDEPRWREFNLSLRNLKVDV